jgi:tetratricopeptide (TPR) repeat protein
MQARLLSWSRPLLLGGVALLILFIIPLAWFPLQLGKLAPFSLLLLIALALFFLDGGMRGLARMPGFALSLLVWLLPLAYLASWYTSTDRTLGILGRSIEGDTLLFTVLCSLAFLGGFALLRTPRAAKLLVLTTVTAIGVAALFQGVVMLFGVHAVPFSIFSDRSVNLVGKWNDLGLLSGFLLLCTVGWLEYADASITRRVVAGLIALALLALLIVIEFSLAWMLVLGFSLLLFVERFFFAGRKIAWVALVSVVLSLCFIVWGVALNTALTKIVPVSALEVRPSFSSTLSVTQEAQGTSAERFLLGEGPDTFGEAWLAHKPESVNQSAFCNLNFILGFSIFFTALLSVGLLGALAWLVPLALVIVGLVRLFRAPTPREWPLIAALALGVGYLWCALVLYVPSESLLLLGFVFAGCAFGLLMATSSAPRTVPHVPLNMLGRTLALLFALGVIVLSLWVAWAVGQRTLAESYTNQGTLLLGTQPAQALALSTQAQKIEIMPDDLQLALAAGYALLQQLASNTSPTAQQQQQFIAQAEQTALVGQRAIAASPHDYQAYLVFGNIYALLASLGAQDAAASAQVAYQNAAIYNPTDPEIPLAQARLAQGQGDAAGAQSALTQALKLKPDYTDAILLEVQLAVARGDTAGAITAAQQAIQSAPGIASSWFELGLLYYSKNDSADAIPVLEQAIKLEPDYANAQYFLGLSYALQGRTADAITQFQALAASNPTSTEVALILSNLESGKPALTGVTPPTSAPQDRSSAPLPQ